MKKSKPAEPPTVEDDGPGAGFKTDNDFLFPKLPGAFKPSLIRKKDLGFLRDRYIQVLSASMGNHGMALHFCCWTQEQYESALDDKFEKRIAAARAQLADRAAYIMHRAMGLVASDEPIAPPTVSAAMAKVVESFGEPSAAKGGLKKAYKLTVNGLQQPAPQSAVVARRGPGRPKREASAGPEAAP